MEKQKQKINLGYTFTLAVEDDIIRQEDIPTLTREEIDALNYKSREKYLKQLSSERYEKLPLRLGESITDRPDYYLKSFSKRSEWVEKTIEKNFDEYETGIRTMFTDDRQLEQHRVFRALNYMGNYLLDASDIDSERKIDQSFYKDEQQYRKGKLGASTSASDMSPTSLVGRTSDIKTDRKSEHLEELKERFVFSRMEDRHIYNLLTDGLAEKNLNTDLSIFMHLLYKKIAEVLDGDELKLVDMLIDGLTQEDISEKIGLTQQAVGKRIGKIIKKLKESGVKYDGEE